MAGLGIVVSLAIFLASARAFQLPLTPEHHAQPFKLDFETLKLIKDFDDVNSLDAKVINSGYVVPKPNITERDEDLSAVSIIVIYL